MLQFLRDACVALVALFVVPLVLCVEPELVEKMLVLLLQMMILVPQNAGRSAGG